MQETRILPALAFSRNPPPELGRHKQAHEVRSRYEVLSLHALQTQVQLEELHSIGPTSAPRMSSLSQIAQL